MFYDKRYYWGKVLNMFAQDTDSDVHSAEFSFLTYKMDGIWDFPRKKDQSIIAVKYVFLGPVILSAVITGKSFWSEEDNDKAQELSRLIKKSTLLISKPFFSWMQKTVLHIAHNSYDCYIWTHLWPMFHLRGNRLIDLHSTLNKEWSFR